MAVPKAHRDRFELDSVSELVVTADRDKCLLLFAKPIWEEVERQLLALPNQDPTCRAMQRLYIGYAHIVEFDSNGRILLPAEHRELAGIDRKAMLVGQGRKFEIWSEEAWAEQQIDLPSLATMPASVEAPDALRELSF